MSMTKMEYLIDYYQSEMKMDNTANVTNGWWGSQRYAFVHDGLSAASKMNNILIALVSGHKFSDKEMNEIVELVEEWG